MLTGEVKSEKRNEILVKFNQSINKKGDIIKVALLSSSVAEGINFKNV